jgi:hypothetical protein
LGSIDRLGLVAHGPGLGNPGEAFLQPGTRLLLG